LSHPFISSEINLTEKNPFCSLTKDLFDAMKLGQKAIEADASEKSEESSYEAENSTFPDWNMLDEKQEKPAF
jgi:hypothetical protein